MITGCMIFLLVALVLSATFLSNLNMIGKNLNAAAQLPGLGPEADEGNNTSLSISTVCRGSEPCQSLVCNNDEPCYMSKSVNPNGLDSLFGELEDQVDEREDSFDDLRE